MWIAFCVFPAVKSISQKMKECIEIRMNILYIIYKNIFIYSLMNHNNVQDVLNAKILIACLNLSRALFSGLSDMNLKMTVIIFHNW